MGVPFAEADRICDPVGVTGRAPNLPDATRHLFLGQVIKRVSCFLRLDPASKLTNQVEESFTGAEGLTKLFSMVPFCDLKKIDLVSSQPFAMYSWLLTVEQSNHIEQVTKEVLGNVPELPVVPVERACSSRSGGASGSSGPVGSGSSGPFGKLKEKVTDLDCARRSVDASFD